MIINVLDIIKAKKTVWNISSYSSFISGLVYLSLIRVLVTVGIFTWIVDVVTTKGLGGTEALFVTDSVVVVSIEPLFLLADVLSLQTIFVEPWSKIKYFMIFQCWEKWFYLQLCSCRPIY